VKAQPWPHALPYAQRWALATAAAKRHRRALTAHPGVVSVGTGFELVGRPDGHHRGSISRVQVGLGTPAHGCVPCVQVVVKKKWKRARTGGLPESVRLRGIDIPVDVVEHLPTALHHWACRAEDATYFENGTGGCFVRRGGAQFLLGCHHVLALSTRRSVESPADVAVSWEGAALGSEVTTPSDLAAADVALARVAGATRPQITVYIDGAPLVLHDALAPGELPPLTYGVLTQRGIVRCDYVGPRSLSDTYADGPLAFDNLVYGLARGDGHLQPGDSGACLVDDHGRFLGIHFAGSPDGGAPTYAIRADVALRAFGPALTLW
jgi:hypothetical protein